MGCGPRSASPSATEVRRNGRKLGGLKLWPVGSSFLKGETYGWLKLERPTAESGEPFPPGFVHLPVHAAGEEFCRQLTAEQLVARAGPERLSPAGMGQDARAERGAGLPGLCPRAAAALGMDGWGDGRWARMADALSLPAAEPEHSAPPSPSVSPLATRPRNWLAPRGGWLR